MWRLFPLILVLSGCALMPGNQIQTPVMVMVPSVTALPPSPPPTATETINIPEQAATAAFPGDMHDMLPIMSGICFESAWDAAGQVFVLRSAEDHIRFYDLADNSELCRRKVVRHPFDFSYGEALAGLWTRGQGCVARHEVVDYQRDDTAKTIHITLNFITDGDCPYELVRPFWVSIPQAQDYDIQMTVNQP